MYAKHWEGWSTLKRKDRRKADCYAREVSEKVREILEFVDEKMQSKENGIMPNGNIIKVNYDSKLYPVNMVIKSGERKECICRISFHEGPIANNNANEKNNFDSGLGGIDPNLFIFRNRVLEAFWLNSSFLGVNSGQIDVDENGILEGMVYEQDAGRVNEKEVQKKFSIDSYGWEWHERKLHNVLFYKNTECYIISEAERVLFIREQGTISEKLGILLNNARKKLVSKIS